MAIIHETKSSLRMAGQRLFGTRTTPFISVHRWGGIFQQRDNAQNFYPSLIETPNAVKSLRKQ